MKNPEPNLARILVVDAVPESAGLIELILRKYGGNDIDRASSIDEAIEKIAKVVPELIFLDADLPDDTSFRFCEQIGRHEKTAGMPVILFSKRKDRQRMVRGFQAGAVDFMFKPIYPMELAARARAHLLLSQEREKTERRAVELQELVQVLCHDITGPVSASIAILEMAKDDPAILPEMAECILQSLEKVNDMTNLVRQMRAFESGKMEWTLEPIPLKAAVEDSLCVLKRRIEDKEIDLSLDISPDILVMAERVSLVNSVVSNLLTNAIKFSNRGSSIEIDAHAETDEVILRIQDHGIGMPESLQKNLFNLKVPTGRQGTNGEPGTGFGMPLVDKFVKGYGGSMRIHSVDINDSPDESGTRIELTFQRPQTG